MEVLTQSKELTKKELYFLTMSQDSQGMKAVVGQTLELDYWVLYTDLDQDGEEKKLFAGRTPEGETYVTNSEAFIRAFDDILKCFEPEEVKAIKVMGGKSKNNREFITCAYADLDE